MTENYLMTTTPLAPIGMESLVKDCCVFSWRKKATKGSSFLALEKNNKTNKLGMESGKWLLKKMEVRSWELGDKNLVLILPIYIVWDFVNLYICSP
jgi:hypothetical protein